MSSVAHSVLFNPDLLSEIFSCLRLPSLSIGNVFSTYARERRERVVLRGTLFAAALVCKAFSQHALDELWYTLDELHCLLYLLPSYMYQKGECFLERAPTAEEWTRLDLYAFRVHALLFDTPIKDRIDPAVWIDIAAHYGGDRPVLLPRLERLVMGDVPHRVSGLGPVYTLLSPTLRHLSIGFDGFFIEDTVLRPPVMSALAEVLHTIAAISPDLSALHLEHWFCLCSSEATLPLTRMRLAELRVCQCKRCAVAVSDLRAFWSASPVPASLRTLAVAVKDIPHGFVTGGLRSLQELSIHGTAGDIAAFIRSVQPTQLLHTVSLKFWRDPNHGPDDAIPSQALVSICRSLPSVQSLEVNMDVLSSELTYPPFPLTAVVATLRPLKNLAGFTLHAGLTHITEVEEGLQMLAELCPSLQSLKIAQSPGLYSPAAVTPRTLSSVAGSFPQLESLSLPRLDAAELLSADNDVPVLAHGLRRVEFLNVCGIPEPSPVAYAIARLFPQLQIEPSTGVEGILGGEWHGEWAHVRALLCKMHGKS